MIPAHLEFHPFEAHRVGGLVIITYKAKFVALGTCIDDKVAFIDDSVQRRAAQKNASRRRKRAAVRAKNEQEAACANATT